MIFEPATLILVLGPCVQSMLGQLHEFSSSQPEGVPFTVVSAEFSCLPDRFRRDVAALMANKDPLIIDCVL